MQMINRIRIGLVALIAMLGVGFASAASADSGYASHYAGRFLQVAFPIVSLTRRDC